MVNEENLNKIYDAVIDGRELTTKELNSYGFNSKDLSDLINDGVIERVSWGHYSLVDFEKLYSFGTKLLHMKEFDKARICFEKCYELNPKHQYTCLQLFFDSINNSNYEKAFQYFKVFYNPNNSDYKFYLYLLSMITEVPEEYREIAKSIQYNDVVVNSKKYNDYDVQNKIRALAFEERFVLAINTLDNDMKGKHNSFNYSIIKLLLKKATSVQKEYKIALIEMINDSNYEGAISHLKIKNEKRSLNTFDYYTMILLESLVDIKESNIIPEKYVSSTDNLFDAIKGRNYTLSFSLVSKYIDEKGIDKNQNAIYLVLAKINEEIRNIKGDNFAIVNDDLEVNIEKSNEVVNNVISSNGFMNVLNFLMVHDLDNCFIALRSYLEKIGKIEYEFLLLDLIKISVLENDMTFVKPMVTLTSLSKNKFEFNIFEYVQSFYISLNESKYEVAKVYIDIISKAKEIVESEILVEFLEQTLVGLEGKKNDKAIIKEKIEVVDSTTRENINSSINDKSISQPKSKNNTLVKTSVNKNVPIKKDYDDVSFINSKLEQLYKNGIVLLRPMDADRIKGIHSIVKGLSDVVSFSIGTEDERRVVLRHTPTIDNFINFRQLIIDGNQAYKDGNYTECIENYRQVLQFVRPKTFVYARLGLAYMKAWNIKLAIDYLTVATELSKLENNEFNFTELIDKLTGRYDPDEERKPYVEMDDSEFIDDMYDYYEVSNVEEIFDLVDSGMSIEEACNSYNLTDEDIKIVYLIFAKKCYSEEKYLNGDNYYKLVEKSSDKTDFVKWLLNEVRRNKKYYKNRVEVLQNNI